jgi:hypothetical protein
MNELRHLNLSGNALAKTVNDLRVGFISLASGMSALLKDFRRLDILRICYRNLTEKIRVLSARGQRGVV